MIYQDELRGLLLGPYVEVLIIPGLISIKEIRSIEQSTDHGSPEAIDGVLNHLVMVEFHSQFQSLFLLLRLQPQVRSDHFNLPAKAVPLEGVFFISPFGRSLLSLIL